MHTPLSLSVRQLGSACTHLSLSLSRCASSRFSVHTPLSLSLSLSVRQLGSACTHLSLSRSLSLCVSSVQRAHTSLSLALSLCISSVQHAHTPLSRSLTVGQLGSACTHLSLSLSRCASARFSMHTPLSLALSLCASARFSVWQLRCSDLSQTRYYVASLILHASVAEITAQLLPLCHVYLILSDDGSIIRIFVQINILEG